MITINLQDPAVQGFGFLFTGVLLITFALSVFCKVEDKGFSVFQKIIRCWMRLSRFFYAVGMGLDAYLKAYRENIVMPLPELLTPKQLKAESEKSNSLLIGAFKQDSAFGNCSPKKVPSIHQN
jgi:hypothetical protein